MISVINRKWKWKNGIPINTLCNWSLSNYNYVLIQLLVYMTHWVRWKWFGTHITGLPGIWCSVFTASPDVSDFFLPKIGQKCQIGDFWGYSGPNLATLWKSVSHFQFGGNLAFLGPKLTDFKVLPDLDVNFPQKSLILAFLANFWWFWIWIIWQRCGNGQNP